MNKQQQRTLQMFLARFALRARPQRLLTRQARAFSSTTPEGADRNDAASVFLESITSTIKGIQHVNNIEEHDKNLTEEQKKSMKRFLIYRSNPSVTEHNSLVWDSITFFGRIQKIIHVSWATMSISLKSVLCTSTSCSKSKTNMTQPSPSEGSSLTASHLPQPPLTLL